MYYPNNIEELCFEQSHIDKVWEEMEKIIPEYFQKMIDTEGGNIIHESDLDKLVLKFGSTLKPKLKPKDPLKILERLLKETIADFEKERQPYLDILNLDSLKEYKKDVGSFKNTYLRNQIPIIRKTLQNKLAKELDKFRISFKTSDPGDIFEVTYNIMKLANELKEDWYNQKDFEQIDIFEELPFKGFDDEGFTVYGVIGGGIKSQFLYKFYPEMCPNRSRQAVWALYYLSNKKRFGCTQDSEFLMIDVKESTTQQNYFYPYGLFSIYALRIFKLIRKIYTDHSIFLFNEHRFIVLDGFLSFVASIHQPEIDLLKQKSQNYHYDY